MNEMQINQPEKLPWIDENIHYEVLYICNDQYDNKEIKDPNFIFTSLPYVPLDIVNFLNVLKYSKFSKNETYKFNLKFDEFGNFWVEFKDRIKKISQ